MYDAAMSTEEAGPSVSPHEVTRAWEVELLVSGATVFGLLQLPSRIDAVYYDVVNRTPPSIPLSMIMLPWFYVKISLLLLIITFIVHLVLRGYWIALIGLSSVYPGGIDWQRFAMGPNQRTYLARRPSIEQHIAAADRNASFIFAIGFGLSLTVLPPMILIVLGLAFFFVLHMAGVGAQRSNFVMTALVSVLLSPLALAVLLDRYRGSWLPPQSRRGRLLQSIFAIYSFTGLTRGSQPLLDLFRSRAEQWRSRLLMACFAFVGMIVMVAHVWTDQGINFSLFPGLPDDGPVDADNLFAEHYGTQRGSEIHTATPRPFIPDRVVTGPYVELFVPYRMARFEPALRATCPQAVQQADTESSRAALDCLTKILDVRIDGVDVVARFDGASDPVTNVRGVVAMIPAGWLAPGRHELTLHQPPDPERPPSARPPRDERIPFWR